MLEGIFLGYHQIAGGGWSGDLLVVDVEALEEADAFHGLYPKRIKGEEVILLLEAQAPSLCCVWLMAQ